MDIRVWENETESCQQTIPERLIGGIRHYISDIRRFSRNVRLYLIGSALMGLNFWFSSICTFASWATPRETSGTLSRPGQSA